MALVVDGRGSYRCIPAASRERTGLADGVTQGNAGSQQFRTAPLWGVGQRLSSSTMAAPAI